jgi:hypothetical protein
MAESSLLSDLNEAVALLKESSERLDLLARRLPKHGATVSALSRTVLNGAEYVQAITVHVQRRPEAA